MNMLRALVVVAGLLGTTVLAGCRQGSTPATQAVKGPSSESLAAKRQARERELAAMALPELVMELDKDSQQGVEPFNSTAYKVITTGNHSAAALRDAIENQNHWTLLAVLALRKMDANEYAKLP